MLKRVVNGPASALALVQNVAEVARYGGLQTADVAAPYAATLLRGPHGALRHYFHDAPPDGPPIVLVVSMPMSAEVWDVSEATSAVRQLHAAGLDPWVVDFGPSGAEEGGLQRTLSDHVLAVSGAVDEVRTRTGRDVHLAGYSQGGMLCYQVAALRRSESLASVITFGAPVDMSKMAPISADAFARVGQALGFVSEHVSVPGWVFRNAFRVVDPVKSARKQAEFVLALHDREALLPREGQRRFIDGRGWVTVPGPALAEFAQQFLAHNRMLEGGFVVDGRTVSLADITCPVLAVIGDIDEIAPARAVRPLAAAAPRAEAWETHVRAGHLGLVLGSKATDQAWPAVIEWTRWIEGQTAEPPAGLQRLSDVDPDDPVAAAGAGSPAGFGPEVVLGVTAGAAHTLMAAGQSLASLGREVVGQVPILTRLQRVKPTTRTSLALTLDEQAAKDPDRIQFIYRERAFTRAEAKRRFDAVARGLIEIGVRRGDRVGVLMSARPSAFAAVAALNRIGALAVLLRPGAEMLREVELGEASRIICDPESVKQARRANRPVFVLGGGPDRPRLPRGVVDLELIDADAVRPPAWYRPNPGRAMDVAFVLFTGEGEATRVNHITNRRWTLSAYGTASAASLRPRDTVYCLAPPSHPSGLLVAMGGAIAGGARFAMTEGFDPARFWDEVRRYGVTVVVYTWTMLSELVDRSPADVERSHPIRLFVGSGMAPALWRRTLRRFAPAGVVEFYTTPNAETVLVNVGASKPGSLGRELPGSASVRVVEWDVDRGRAELDNRGLARLCEPDAVGMLLAQVDPHEASAGHVPALRAVFDPEDAWVVTGDLVRRDVDGDIWFVDRARDLFDTSNGRRSPTTIANMLEALDEIDLAVAYAAERGEETVAVAAVRLRAGVGAVTAETLAEKIRQLPTQGRPEIVHIVEQIPMTPWHRPTTHGLPGATAQSADRSAAIDS